MMLKMSDKLSIKMEYGKNYYRRSRKKERRGNFDQIEMVTGYHPNIRRGYYGIMRRG